MTTPTTVQVRFQFRADTAANWTSIDPVLLANELGRETDTGKIKIGDGTTAWSSLGYQALGRISDSDIAADAEIAVSKLANGTANQILTTDGTDVSWTDSPTIAGNVIISGDLTVNGTETIINVETLQVEDHQIEIGNVTTPSDLTADSGGIVLKGATDKTILWVDSTDSWTSSENVDLASGKTYKIDGTDVLSATTLGSGVTGSSLTSVGDLTDLTVDTDTLVVDATNDRVGIGEATPGSLLHLSADAAHEITLERTGGSASISKIKNAGNLLVFEQNTNGISFETGTSPSENARIDSAGRLLVGSSTSYTTSTSSSLAPLFQVHNTGLSQAQISINSWATGTNTGGSLSLCRSDSGTIGTHQELDNGDYLGNIRFSGSDGDEFIDGAAIKVVADGAWSDGVAPAEILFQTNDGTSGGTPTTRFRIGANGNTVFGTGDALSNTNIYLTKDATGGTSAFGFRTNQEIQPDVTSTFRAFSTLADTAANGGTAYTLSNLRHFEAQQGTFHADSTVSSQIAFRASGNLDDATNNFGFVSDIDEEAGHGNFNFYASGTADNYFAGNVGIGVTSPGYELDVRGTSDTSIRIESTGTGSSDDTVLRMAIGGTTASNFIFFGDSDDSNAGQIRYNHSSNSLTVNTNGSTAATINSSGALLVQGVYDTTTSSGANVNVHTDGTIRRSTSSAKYKTNIETIEDSYADALLQCRPVWYRSTCEGDNPEHGYWGFIAEEVAEIDPRLVFWKTFETTHDENGSVVTTPCNPEPEGVQYDRFVPHLLNLIKRQQQAIETLEAKVATLEAG